MGKTYNELTSLINIPDEDYLEQGIIIHPQKFI